MSHAVAGMRTGQRFKRTYALQATNAIDLSKVYLRDTVILDDTGATGATVVTLPKIGTAYAPVGLRAIFRKPSTVAHGITLTPDAQDGISSTAGAAFPGFSGAGVANTSALPTTVPNSVTLEATDMALTGSTQPNPSGGTPTTAGAWMIVASSVASV